MNENNNQGAPSYNNVARAKRDYSKLGRRNFKPPPTVDEAAILLDKSEDEPATPIEQP